MVAKKKTAEMRFGPKFSIKPSIANALMRIEAVKEAIKSLPITPRVLTNLRQTARLFSTHYSTMIEGNRLTQEQVAKVIEEESHFPGRERDQLEVKGYYAALDEVERIAKTKEKITENAIQKIHALVMGGGKLRVKPTPYRDGQNIIKDGQSKAIVYLPPEAKDVPPLIAQLVAWLNQRDDLPVPIKAGIAHYQFATIHPYYDGNGRTARLLTSLVLHLGGYDLKGLYALEEYYARNLKDYYEALTVGTHNYYSGRATKDITKWVSYFTGGMANSFERVRAQAALEAGTGSKDQSKLLRNLDTKQRKALTLFSKSREIAAKDITKLFGYSPRTASLLCQRWVESGFLLITNSANKTRRYRLSEQYEAMVISA